MRDTDACKRTKIITLHQHTGKTCRQISELTNVHYSTVSRIIKRYQRDGSITPVRKGNCGRKSKTTMREKRMVVTTSRINPRLNAIDIRNRLDLRVSNRTVRRILVNAGRLARNPRKKQLLTKPMMVKRLQWAKAHSNWDIERWKKVLYTDESHFEVKGNTVQFVRRATNEPLSPAHISQSVKHPLKVMFWGCFSYGAPGRLHICEGMMDQKEYCKVIEHRVIPELAQRFPNGDGILQHDKAPCHMAKSVTKKLHDSQIPVLAWPANSPDVAPIENLWQIVKEKLTKIDTTTKPKLIRAVLDVWNHDESIVRSCEKLVESMPNRVKALIKAKGGHIHY